LMEAVDCALTLVTGPAVDSNEVDDNVTDDGGSDD